MHLFYLVNITDALSMVSHGGPACKERNIGLIFVKGPAPIRWSTAIETPFPGFPLCCGSQRRGFIWKEGALTEASWQLPSGFPLIWLRCQERWERSPGLIFCFVLFLEFFWCGPFFNSLLNLLQYCFCFMWVCFCCCCLFCFLNLNLFILIGG